MSDSNLLIFKTARRYSQAEAPATLYEAAYKQLSALARPWGLNGVPMVPMQEIRGRGGIGINYTKQSRASPVKAFWFAYMTRHRTCLPDDRAVHDDSLHIEFYPNKFDGDWTYLLDVVFPAYLAATRPYAARLVNQDIEVNDVFLIDERGDASPNPAFIDQRLGVNRIWQANFWDRTLCQRAFGLTPEEIVTLLFGKVANCRIVDDGVLTIYSYEHMLAADIRRIDEVIKPLLRK